MSEIRRFVNENREDNDLEKEKRLKLRKMIVEMIEKNECGEIFDIDFMYYQLHDDHIDYNLIKEVLVEFIGKDKTIDKFLLLANGVSESVLHKIIDNLDEDSYSLDTYIDIIHNLIINRYKSETVVDRIRELLFGAIKKIGISEFVNICRENGVEFEDRLIAKPKKFFGKYFIEMRDMVESLPEDIVVQQIELLSDYLSIDYINRLLAKSNDIDEVLRILKVFDLSDSGDLDLFNALNPIFRTLLVHLTECDLRHEELIGFEQEREIVKYLNLIAELTEFFKEEKEAYFKDGNPIEELRAKYSGYEIFKNNNKLDIWLEEFERQKLFLDNVEPSKNPAEKLFLDLVGREPFGEIMYTPLVLGYRHLLVSDRKDFNSLYHLYGREKDPRECSGYFIRAGKILITMAGIDVERVMETIWHEEQHLLFGEIEESRINRKIRIPFVASSERQLVNRRDRVVESIIINELSSHIVGTNGMSNVISLPFFYISDEEIELREDANNFINDIIKIISGIKIPLPDRESKRILMLCLSGVSDYGRAIEIMSKTADFLNHLWEIQAETRRLREVIVDYMNDCIANGDKSRKILPLPENENVLRKIRQKMNDFQDVHITNDLNLKDVLDKECIRKLGEEYLFIREQFAEIERIRKSDLIVESGFIALDKNPAKQIMDYIDANLVEIKDELDSYTNEEFDSGEVELYLADRLDYLGNFKLNSIKLRKMGGRVKIVFELQIDGKLVRLSNDISDKINEY